MKKNVVLLTALLVGMAACKETSEPGGRQEISMKELKGSIEDVVESVTYLPLNITEQSALSRVHKMVVDDGLYFLADFNNSKLSVYDKAGNVRYVLDRRGHGKGEYLEIRNFTTSGKRLYTIDNFKNEINIFDKSTGEYIETKKSSVIASDIVALNDNKFLMTAIPNGHKWAVEQDKYLVFEVDGNFKVKNSYFPYGSDYIEPLSRYSYFSKAGGKVVFSSFGSNGYCLMQDGTEQVHVNLDSPIPADGISEQDNYSNNRYQYVSQTPIMCNRYVYMEINDKGINKCYVYDTQTNSLYSNGDDAKIKMSFVVGSDNEAFICYIPDAKYYSALKSSGLKSAGSAVEEKLNNGAAALVLYKMK